MERPLLIPLTALIAGIGSSAFTGWSAPESLYLLSIPLFLAGLFVQRSLLLMSSIACCAFAYGAVGIASNLTPVFPEHHIARYAHDTAARVTGVVAGRPELREQGTRLVLDVETVELNRLERAATGRLLVFIRDGKVSCLSGDRVQISLRLKPPRNFGLPGEFDYQRFLALKGIHATGFSSRATDLKLLESAVARTFQRRLDLAAFGFSRLLKDSAPETEAAVLDALLLGARGSVPRDIDQLYARGGVNHILSISGFHIGILALALYGAFMALLRLFELPLLFNVRRFLPVLIVPVLFCYMALSGGAPATVRSFLMIAACFLALFIERETDSLNLLALAALCILLISPQALFDLSFQLSFLALWGIIVLTPLLMKPFHGMARGIPYRLLQFCMVSLAAILATLLPVAHQFHHASVSGLISNLVVVPLLGYGAVVTGFGALVVSFIAPAPAAFLVQIAAQLVAFCNRFLLWMDRIPQLPHFTPSLLDVYLGVAFLALLTLVRTNRSRLIGAFGILLILVAGHGVGSDPGKEAVRVDFLSLGQCESTLVRFPDGKTLLVDGGGPLMDGGTDVGERLLAPALRTLGVGRIDYMVLSHPHPDHLSGLLYIAENFPVGEFWETGYPCAIPSYLRLRSTLRDRGIPVRTINASVPPFALAGGRIEPLAPFAPAREAYAIPDYMTDVNDESMVFRLVVGKFSVLFTGDSGFATEAYLLGEPEQLRATVLKVAHHGSRRSSSAPFLQAVSPRIALIAAGYRNRFNLPSPETLRDIEAAGTAVYRTDRDGSVGIAANSSTGATAVSRILPSLR